MFIKRSIILVFLLSILLCFSTQNAFAKSKNEDLPAGKAGLPTVTVINPIRGPELGLEKADLLASLKGQWGVIEKADIPATWLWQYSALEDKKLTNFAQSNMKNPSNSADRQEFGIFLEIDKNFADKSGVRYRGSGPWYFSDRLFLVSYEQDDRKKLISKVFETFKNTFGYYPKTVGAWWVGAESIQYMQQRYGITSVIQCADQFDTDKYSIWGTPWSISYIPSARNSAIPASSLLDSANVVISQWATRDPVMAYGDSVKDSTYSIQDFGMKSYDYSYLSYLRDIYLNKSTDQIVIGLESGFSKEAYTGGYQKEMEIIKEWEDKGKIRIQTSEAYSKDFIKSKQIYPKTYYFLSSGYNTKDQAFWYHSTNFRIGIQKKGKDINIIDFRDYLHTSEEDFYKLPNTQSLLRINTKAIIDSARFPDSKTLLLSTNKMLSIKEEKNEVSLLAGDELIASFSEKRIVFPTLKQKNLSSVPFFNSISIFPFFSIVFLVIVLYTIYCLFYSDTKDKRVLVSIFCLIFSLVVLYPIYSSGQFYNATMSFTPFSLTVFPLLSYLSFNPMVKIFIVYQIFPILFLILFHFLLTRKVKNPFFLIGIYFIFSIAFFSYMDNYPQSIMILFSQGRKAKLLLLALIGVIVLFLFLLLKLYKNKENKILLFLMILLSVSLIVFNKDKIFSKRNQIIAPFEQEALMKVFYENKNVFFLSPEFNAQNFQTITPFLADRIKDAEYFTSTKWERVSLENKPYVFKEENSLLVVPRYLGADIQNDGTLKKIFDNAQIAIYKKK